MLPTKESTQLQGHTNIKIERIEKDIPCKWNQKTAAVAILISEK